jgi:site-specific DNA-methyltransferase (adenine-specific)
MSSAPATEAPPLTPAEAGARAAWADAQPKTVPVNQVIHGDCQQVLRLLPEACVDMVLTDPPYLVRYTDRAGRQVPNDDNTHWMFPAFSELYRVMKPNSYCVSFYGWGKADRFLNVWRECGFQAVGHFVWVKRYASCMRHTRMKHEQAYLLTKGNPVMPKDPPSDVLDWAYTGNRLHPTQKPVSGLVPLIRAYSKPGDLVADPFAGSGSTGVAARNCGRRYLLIEKDAGYHRAACDRLTHQVPARLI